MSITVNGIKWTRTYLEVDYEATENESLALFRVATKRFMFFREERVCKDEGESVHAVLNIVIAEKREPLDAGDWVLCTRVPDELLESEQKLYSARPYMFEQAVHLTHLTLSPAKREDEGYKIRKAEKIGFGLIKESPYDTHPVRFSQQLLLDLEDLSKVFRYGNGMYAYTASLIPRLDRTDCVYVVLNVAFYERNEKPRIRKRSLRFREKQLMAAFARFLGLFVRSKGNNVLFLKENGTEPTENMAAIRDRMVERHLDREFVIIERYRNTFASRRQSIGAWLKDIKMIAGSDYIFIDDYCPIFNFIKPGGNTVLVQVWHAGVGFKSVGYARFGIAGSPDPYSSSHRSYTYALVGNERLRSVYSEVFGIEEEALLATGMPRLDHFLDEAKALSTRERLTERYPWLNDGRIIVFAPTFRGASQRTAYYPYETYLDFEALFEMCERTNSFFVFEMHHFIDDLPDIPERYASRLKDLSHEKLDDLYHVCDVLVTDYSSCFYDYLLLQRPVLFYTPDRVEYSATRGVQRPIDVMAPGMVCDSFDVFVDALESGEYESVEPDPSCLDRRLEGPACACDRVIDTVLLGRDVPGVKLAQAGA